MRAPAAHLLVQSGCRYFIRRIYLTRSNGISNFNLRFVFNPGAAGTPPHIQVAPGGGLG
jgi:hypothetical protein